MERSGREGMWEGGTEEGEGGGEPGLAAASKWLCFCKWLRTDPGVGAPLASPPSSHEACVNGSRAFTFSHPLRPQSLQGCRRCPQVCAHTRWRRSSVAMIPERVSMDCVWKGFLSVDKDAAGQAVAAHHVTFCPCRPPHRRTNGSNFLSFHKRWHHTQQLYRRDSILNT